MADNYKKIKFDRNNTIFSLYGSRVKEIKFHNKTLKLKIVLSRMKILGSKFIGDYHDN